jgi:hypothetical protein
MMKTIALFPILLLCIPVMAVAEDDFSLPAKEVAKFSALMKDIFDGWMVDDRGKALEAKNELAALVSKIEKDKEVEDLLAKTDFWYRIREGAIDRENKILNREKGKGFRLAQFEDFTETPPKVYQYLMSVPKAYDPDEDARYPVILFLHPEITGRGKKVEKEVPKMLKTMYSDDDILSQYMVIAPLGPMGGKRGKTLIDAGKDWENLEGRKTAFLAIRLLLEQMVFDRTRVILDGVGKAGLSACRYATWYPSYFAGVITRDATLAPIAVENVRDIPFFYLSSADNNKKQLDTAKTWKESYPEEGGSEEGGKKLRFKLFEDAGELKEPSPEAVTAIKEWMGGLSKETAPKEIYLKTADLETAGCNWLRIRQLNTGLDMKLDDPDYPWIKAKIDPDTNTIVLDSKRVLKVMLFLNDKLVNLDQKVSVIFNGKKRFDGKVERNLDRLIELSYSAGEFEVYCNWLELSEEE